jgi:O-antigen ligase
LVLLFALGERKLLKASFKRAADCGGRSQPLNIYFRFCNSKDKLMIKKDFSFFFLTGFFLFLIPILFFLIEIKGIRSLLSLSAVLVIILSSWGMKKTPLNLFFLFLTGILFFFPLIHFCVNENYYFEDFSESILWIVGPFAFYLSGKSLGRRVVVAGAFLWVLNLLVSIHMGNLSIGLPGNFNWQAAFILGTSPLAVVWCFYKTGAFSDRNRWISRIICILAISCVLVYTLWRTQSRAAYLSLFVLIVMLAFIRFFKRRYLPRLILCGLFLVVALPSIIFSDFLSRKIAEILFHDVRPALWVGTLRLIQDMPLLGAGQMSLPSVLMPYRPIGYFLRSHHFAHIPEHPHNHFLYILSCFGLIAGTIHIGLILYPLFFCLKRLRRLSLRSKGTLVSFFLLLFCAMFDKIYFEYYTLFLMIMLQGLLWQKIFPLEKKYVTEERRLLFGSFLLKGTASFIVICFLASYLWNFVLAARLYTSAGIFADKKPSAALNCSANASLHKREPYYSFYGAYISLSSFQDPHMTEFFIGELSKTPCPSLSRSELIMADAQALLGRNLAALSYLEKDLQNFPISIESLYKKALLEKISGKNTDMEMTLARLNRALKHKGLLPKDIPSILNESKYDHRFSEYKKLKEDSLSDHNLR